MYWLRTSLPFRLNAVNLWLLQDGDAWTMVDCGYPTAEVRVEIEQAWSRLLGGRPIRRIIVTHHHPDHVGNCRWICERWGIVPCISQCENAKAQEMARGGVERGQQRVAFWQRHGLSSALSAQVIQTWGRKLKLLLPFDNWQRICDGDRFQVGGDEWKAIVAKGHSPEQVLLYSPQRKLLISGDQVLYRITPNVGVPADTPEANPLALFLESNRHLAATCGDAMVLPSHGKLFRGLQSRIRAIEKHHDERLKQIERELRNGPRSAAALIPTLFGDPGRLTPHEVGFAIGEAIAHLNYLVAQGRARRDDSSGIFVFTAN